MCDLLQINMEQWHERLPDFTDRIEHYYRLMTPGIILEKLDPMLKRLIREQKKPG
jgi:hypothetical protein